MTQNLRIVTKQWFESTDRSIRPVDVRDERDYAELGHLPGAVSIPYDRFRDASSASIGKFPPAKTFETLLASVGIDPDTPILAYDSDTGVYAARFLLTAAAYGHRGDLYLLDGGFEDWRRSAQIQTETPKFDPTEYEAAELDRSIVVDRQRVEATLDSDAILVDTRTPAEYAQAHIPGAIQVGWEELLEDGKLRPEDEIESLLEEKGIRRDNRVVLYCNTARRLSHTYVTLRHLGFSDIEVYEGSLTDWIRAESPDWDPLQLKEDIEAIASEGFDALPATLGEDVFSRLHLIGLYTQRQDGYFMLRTKVPCGVLSAEQAREFGTIAHEFARASDDHGGDEQNPEFGDGFLDITTRQGLQLHWIRIEDMPEIWERYDEVGLTTIQASGNTLRNVVTCPAAGVADEVSDVRPLGENIADRFEGDRTLANLPRKLKVSITGCHENCARAEIQDVAYTPAVKDGRDGFHVKVGGGLSDGPRTATDLGIFVRPEYVEDLTVAIAEVFIDHGSYLDTAVNRLKFIVQEWGIDAFRKELEHYVDFTLESPGESLTTDYRADHVGVNRQDDGGYYVGLNVPTGRMLGSDLVAIADLAERYGSAQLRTTSNQNVVIPDVEPESLGALLSDPIVQRYSPDPGPFSRGIVTCTGSEFCSYGVIETKSRAIRWARTLDEWIDEVDGIDSADFGEAIRIHMSGCSASCAQPQIDDIGLRGERARDDDEDLPAADIGLGGDLSKGAFIDWVASSVRIRDVPDAVKRALLTFAEERRSGESFADWTARTSIPELRAVVTGEDGSTRIEAEVS